MSRRATEPSIITPEDLRAWLVEHRWESRDDRHRGQVAVTAAAKAMRVAPRTLQGWLAGERALPPYLPLILKSVGNQKATRRATVTVGRR